MHPINHSNFGTLGITAVFNNGTSVVNGYVVKQTGAETFLVSDRGSVTKTCTLAQTSDDATNLPAGMCTMLITGNSGTGASLRAKYLPNEIDLNVPGTSYAVNDTLVLPDGLGTFVVTAVGGGGAIAAVSGTVVPISTTPGNPIPVASTSGTGSLANFQAFSWVLNQVIIDAGGTGYQTGEALSFTGLVAGTGPTAHVSVVDANGAITAITKDFVGAVITTPAASIGVGGGQEHIRAITSTKVATVEGNIYSWARTASASAKMVHTGP